MNIKFRGGRVGGKMGQLALIPKHKCTEEERKKKSAPIISVCLLLFCILVQGLS